jgi:hypothetical protein
MRAKVTEKLIGELVIVNGMSNSPEMVVKAVDVKTEIITTFWFLTYGEYKENQFPAAVLEKAQKKEVKQSAKTAKVTPKTTKSRKPLKR